MLVCFRFLGGDIFGETSCGLTDFVTEISLCRGEVFRVSLIELLFFLTG